MANIVYTYGLGELLNGGIDMDTDTIKMMLVDASYTPDKDHDFVDDASANEISVDGYARQALGSRTVTVNTTDDRAEFDAANVAFGALDTGETIAGAIIFEDRGGADSANPMILYMDLTNTPTNGSTVTVEFDAIGLFYLEQGA